MLAARAALMRQNAPTDETASYAHISHKNAIAKYVKPKENGSMQTVFDCIKAEFTAGYVLLGTSVCDVPPWLARHYAAAEWWAQAQSGAKIRPR